MTRTSFIAWHSAFRGSTELRRSSAGSHCNELTRYRYDVTLHLDEARQQQGVEPVCIDWEASSWTLFALHDRLDRERPAVLCLRGVPNARLQADLRLWELAFDPGGPPAWDRCEMHLENGNPIRRSIRRISGS